MLCLLSWLLLSLQNAQAAGVYAGGRACGKDSLDFSALSVSDTLSALTPEAADWVEEMEETGSPEDLLLEDWDFPLDEDAFQPDETDRPAEEFSEQAMAEQAALWEETTRQLEAWRTQPLDLNRARREDLEIFPFLDPLFIDRFLEFRARYGGLRSIQELQLVPGSDRVSLQFLSLYACVKPLSEQPRRQSLAELLRRGRHELVLRADIPFYTRDGYRSVSPDDPDYNPDKLYAGPALSHSLRYAFRSSDRLQFGLTAANDAGEPFFVAPNRAGYDSYSLYLLYRSRGWLRTLALGKYRATFGQGLILGYGFLGGKSSSVSSAGFQSTAIRAHSSTDEYNYLHGAALTLAPFDRLTVTALYSRRSLDGRSSRDTLYSISTDGYHRLPSEIDRKDAAVLQTVGGALQYDRSTFCVGLNAVAYFFDKDYQRPLRDYNTHYFRGRQGHNISLDYRCHFRHVLLAGEAASDPHGNIALLQSVRYNLPKGWESVLIYRYYDSRYRSFHAHSFGEGSQTQNESGLYFSLVGNPLPRLKTFLYADYFRFPERRYRVSRASSGWEGYVQAAYTLRTDLEIEADYRHKSTERNLGSQARPDENSTDVFSFRSHRFRLNLRYQPLPGQLALKTSAQCIRTGYSGHSVSRGYLLGQSAAYTPGFLPIRLNASFVYFDTDSYDARLYLYEYGLLYSYSVPAYYGRGTRLSLTLRCDLHARAALMCKCGLIRYTDRDQISSGPQTIRSSQKADLQLLLRLKI